MKARFRLPLLILLAASLVIVIANTCCGGDDAGDDDDDDFAIDASAGGDGAPGATDATPGTDAPVASFCTPTSGTDIRLEEVASGLSRPVMVTAPPSDTRRLFVVEQAGTIRIIDLDTGLLATPFLDITDLVRDTGNEQGLLGLAFHPDYASNRRFFVHYTGSSGETVIAEYRASAGDPDVADATETRIGGSFPLAQPYSNHNGGSIEFGPDGYLYIGLGDGGSGGDPQGNGQNPDTLLATLLRIDVTTLPYTIPSDNPFVGTDGADEVFAYGLRNPYRFSFDRATGDIYIGDVGQNEFEEVDVLPAGSGGGQNYGWNILEGDDCYNAGSCTEPAGYVPPVVSYAHTSSPCDSVTGGFVYRGACLPDYQGVYFYGDYCRGQVWTFELAGGAATNHQEITSNIDPTGLLDASSGSGLAGFGEDGFGELYIAAFNGSVYRIAIQ